MMQNYLQNRTILKTFAVLAGVFLLVQTAYAQTVVRTGETVSIAEDQVIEGNFYSAAGIVNVSGNITEDALVAGGQINLNGEIGADALLVGGSVDVHGTVSDDVRIIAGEAIIAEPILGDVLVIGGMVSILSSASVAGDVLVYGGQATIEGSVGGDVLGQVEQLRIDSAVAGSVDVTVNQLTLGDRAEIAGSVRYVSTNLATQALNANVGGELVRSDPVLPQANYSVRSALIPMLILLFSALVWYLVSRQTLTKVADRALSHSLRSALLGTATLFLAPAAAVILISSIIGMFVGLMLLLAYLLGVILAFIGSTAVIGQLMMRVFNQPSANLTLITLGVGVIGVSLFMLLPIIGQLAFFVFLVLTMGGLVDLLVRPKVK